MVDVLILNYNDSDTVIENVSRIKNYNNINHILIVDNCSRDDSVEKLKEIKNDRVELIVSDKNGGYGYGNNFGIKYMVKKYNSKYILLSNPDTIIEDEVIKKLHYFLINNNDYSIVAPFMLDKDKKKQYNSAFKILEKWKFIMSFGMVYSKLTFCSFYKNLVDEIGNVKDVDTVSGSLFMFDAHKMIKYGMYDENMFLYGEETVLGLKMKQANQKVALLLNESFIHNHSVSISKTYKSEVAKRKIRNKSRLYILKKYYNANFFERLVAFLISILSLIELFIISLFKK